MFCARFRRAVVLKDQALGVFVSEVSFPFDRIRQRIVDRLVQASGNALDASGMRVRSPVDGGNTPHGAHLASRIAGLAGAADQWMAVEMVPAAALDDPATTDGILQRPRHKGSTISTGMLQRA